ncbi:ovostatin-like, partial [Stegodyphus dumicola]|uniref:ovostatin-like n=1 Tax=Stegodyphus dumicola TaxID=202533 RepID=UPI0015AAC2A2
MNVWNAFLICYILCTVKLGNAKKGFILTSPKVLDAGTTEYFTLSVFDVPPGEEITIHLLRINDNSVLAESKVNVLPNHNMWVEMFIPPLKDVKRAKLHIFGTFSGLSSTYKIDEKQEVSIRSRSDLTLIQTDKPLYKPGQTVRFRVLPMDSELKPLGKDATGDIWVEDSNGIRVSQWKNLTFER